MEQGRIPEKFSAMAVKAEIRRITNPVSPNAWMIRPGNQKTLADAWKRRTKRNIDAAVRHLKKRNAPEESIQKATRMLDAVGRPTHTEFKAFKRRKAASGRIYLIKVAGITLGYDYFARFPEILADEALNPQPAPDISDSKGILHITGSYPVRINEPGFNDILAQLPAPLIMAWQGAVNEWIKSYENPDRAERHSLISSSWNRLGGQLAERSGWTPGRPQPGDPTDEE